MPTFMSYLSITSFCAYAKCLLYKFRVKSCNYVKIARFLSIISMIFYLTSEKKQLRCITSLFPG